MNTALERTSPPRSSSESPESSLSLLLTSRPEVGPCRAFAFALRSSSLLLVDSRSASDVELEPGLGLVSLADGRRPVLRVAVDDLDSAEVTGGREAVGGLLLRAATLFARVCTRRASCSSSSESNWISAIIWSYAAVWERRTVMTAADVEICRGTLLLRWRAADCGCGQTAVVARGPDGNVRSGSTAMRPTARVPNIATRASSCGARAYKHTCTSSRITSHGDT